MSQICIELLWDLGKYDSWTLAPSKGCSLAPANQTRLQSTSLEDLNSLFEGGKFASNAKMFQRALGQNMDQLY